MKAKRGEIDRVVAAPGTYRLYLLHGPDQAASRALAHKLATSIGPDTERVALSAPALRSDPALLADEAGAFSLFGGTRLIFIEGGGDELLPAIDALLATPVGAPVVIVAGSLKKNSKLLAMVENAPDAIAAASYLPEGRDADRLVIDLGRATGLDIEPDLARQLAVSSGGDRALLTLELEKYALFLDASPDRRATLTREVIEALSATNEEGDLTAAVDAVLGGEPVDLEHALARLAGTGTEDIVLTRALVRRILLLAKHRAVVEDGSSVDRVMAAAGPSIFHKEKAAVSRQLSGWSAGQLANLLTRTLGAEQALKAGGSVGADGAHETLFAIATATARRR